MRLATILTLHGPRAAIAAADGYIDLHATDPGLPTCAISLLAGSEDDSCKAAAEAASSPPCRPSTPRMPSRCHCRPSRTRARSCASETSTIEITQSKAVRRFLPSFRRVFGKFPNTLIAHGDPIKLPKVANKVDYEAELVIVIGKTGKHIPNDASAFDYVAGYTCGHDVSARDWQFRGEEKQWTIGKTFDTFAPIGPVLVTADEIPDPHNLQVQLRLNGTTLQNSNTKEFIFGVPHLLWFLSQVVTLEPGDLIFTGTPPGVGIARKPPILLKAGDVAEVEIEKIGVLKNPVVAES